MALRPLVAGQIRRVTDPRGGNKLWMAEGRLFRSPYAVLRIVRPIAEGGLTVHRQLSFCLEELNELKNAGVY